VSDRIEKAKRAILLAANEAKKHITQEEWASVCDDLTDWFDREAEENWEDLGE
jgi:hypothetical protein